MSVSVFVVPMPRCGVVVDRDADETTIIVDPMIDAKLATSLAYRLTCDERLAVLRAIRERSLRDLDAERRAHPFPEWSA